MRLVGALALLSERYATIMRVPSATVIDYLDKHSGASTALLTLALVLVTIFYAVQNRRMVGEMAKTRALAILPKLAVEFLHIGPNVMNVAVKNVGPGPALTVDIELTFDPADATAAPNTRRYRQTSFCQASSWCSSRRAT